MTLAFASGKGGTGKTTFSTAFVIAAEGRVAYLDCDVEEPDSHFFIKPDISSVEEVFVPVPAVDTEKCSGCGRCAEVCRFNAVVMIGKSPLFFHELCHSCGGCTTACPESAIREENKRCGIISSALTGSNSKGRIDYFQGKIDVGNAKSPPLIRAVKEKGKDRDLVIIDCPPGSTCPMVTAVRDSDFAVLVTEPSPFGLHDLKLAVSAVRELGVPFGVILNRSSLSFSGTWDFCESESIPVFLEVPESREAASGLSRGVPLTDIVEGIEEKIQDVILSIGKAVSAV